ncbi:hypothetical protein ACEPAG_179 [Sanghuangporus baumii]
MRCQPVRVLKAISSRKYGQTLAIASSKRTLWTSPVCLEEAEPAPKADPERTKGVPLAYEYGGVSIESTRKRPSLTQILAARSGTVIDAPSSAGKVPDRRTPRDARVGSRGPQDGRGNRGRSRSPSRDQQRPRFQGAPRTGQGKGSLQSAQMRERSGQLPSGQEARPSQQARPDSQQSRPVRQARPDQQARPGQQYRSGQPRTADRGPRDQQRGGGGGAKRQASGLKRKRARSNKGDKASAGRMNRTKDPELNDYPNEERNPTPARKYDENGILQLKGPHEQINPVVAPILPKLPTPSVTTSDATSLRSLQLLSYLDRVPPMPIAHKDHEFAGIVDDASRALTRMREVNMHRRRDALSIVEKMAKSAGKLDKGATTNA